MFKAHVCLNHLNVIFIDYPHVKMSTNKSTKNSSNRHYRMPLPTYSAIKEITSFREITLEAYALDQGQQENAAWVSLKGA